jgi:hypothetical protein
LLTFYDTKYLAYLPEANAKPQSLSFFKIAERGYNAKDKLWANEEVIKTDRKDTFQLPSDIKPGMYVLRTELLSLHYASKSGPQFYPHCFNLEILGSGTETPVGVNFPGGYNKTDPSLIYPLYDKAGKQNNWDKYIIPGPRKYAGNYDSPTGAAPKVSKKDRGVFPKEFQAKYDSFKKRFDEEALSFNKKLNDKQEALQHKEVDFINSMSLMPVFQEHRQAQTVFNKELVELKKEAVKLGIAV